MKAHLIPVLAIIFWLSSAAASLAQQSFIVSGNPYAPPVVWEEQRKLTGVAAELVDTIFNELSISYTTRLVESWQKVQTEARAGNIDLIVSAYRNDERAQYLNFSVPYLAQPTVVVVEKGKEFKLIDWNSLKGKKGVSNIGESYGQELDRFIKEHLDVGYYQLERAIQQLNLGQADYLIIDLYTALAYARLLRGEDSVTILEPPLTVQDFHFALQKDSPLNAHLDDINKLLQEKVESGEVARLFLKHYDRWKQMAARQSRYLSANAQERSAQQEAYLQEQDELARQRILKTMTDREGLPSAAQ
jgi:polar amino acid transport system substrate-binding protein